MQTVSILALQLKKMKNHTKCQTQKEREREREGERTPATAKNGWYLCTFYIFSAGLRVPWLVCCAKATLDMFWTAIPLSWTVGQTGRCRFNTNVQNATDTHHSWSLEYLGWGLVWQESKKYCLGLVSFFVSKVKLVNMLHPTRSNWLICLLFAIWFKRNC